MKAFFLCLSVLALGGCCSDCDTEGSYRRGAYYYNSEPTVQDTVYVAPPARYNGSDCRQGSYNGNGDCAPKAHSAKRPVGTVYEVTTYETRYEPRTVKTGSYQTTEYNNGGCR